MRFRKDRGNDFPILSSKLAVLAALSTLTIRQSVETPSSSFSSDDGCLKNGGTCLSSNRCRRRVLTFSTKASTSEVSSWDSTTAIIRQTTKCGRVLRGCRYTLAARALRQESKKLRDGATFTVGAVAH